MKNSNCNRYPIVLMLGVLFISSAVSSALVVSQKPVGKAKVPDASAVPSIQYDQGSPNSNEQYLMEITNRCRANPQLDIKRILNSTDSHIQSALNATNTTAWDPIDRTQIIKDFAAYAAQPPLAFNPCLSTAAKNQCANMITYDYQGHGDYDGGPSTLAERLANAGYTNYYSGGENVYAYAYSVMYAHAAFLVDWGVEDLGHRKLLLGLEDGTNFREMGIAVVSEGNESTKVGPMVVAEEFGYQNSQVAFITGVVYEDIDEDGFYDPGEGVANVQIMPDHGEYYAVTSSSGGFSIPVAINSGQYVLTATRSNMSTMTASVQVTGENVKVDFSVGSMADASIHGSVVDSSSQAALANVKVTLNPGGYEATSGADGTFSFTGLTAGEYTVTATLDGYTFEPNNFNVTLTSAQNYQTTLAATTSDVPGKDIIGCAPFAVVIMTLLSLGFGSLSISCRKN